MTTEVQVLPEAGRPDTHKQLDLSGGLTLDEVKSIGQVFHQSGMFKDTKSAAQAITKILAGQELAIPPMAAMRGIHIIDGNPQLSAALIGGKVKSSGKYDYRIVQADEKVCEIKWLQRTAAGAWEPIGDSKFTLAEAEKIPTKEYGKEIKLSQKTNWRNYTEDMLVARALSRGARRHCPDVFFGGVYAVGEPIPEVDDLPEPLVQRTPMTPDPTYTPPRVARLHEESRPAEASTGPAAPGEAELFPPSQDELDAQAADEHRDPA